MLETDLETRLMNWLQQLPQGQTLEQLSDYLKIPHVHLLVALHKLHSEGSVVEIKNGVWKMVRWEG
jgi:hypothetical protein